MRNTFEDTTIDRSFLQTLYSIGELISEENILFIFK